ncbi:hypothetical protein Nepgr_006866 [Nepenthes gracilis]|uniref:DUF7804 domain-containing protein n=1 Tax=Nepenthes gracilis TaxID=150966 RepID=A0AAD3XI01_NEPGR|nr:hypothetical protein Nepgr_006866 [Nepenthes gracilis]
MACLGARCGGTPSMFTEMDEFRNKMNSSGHPERVSRSRLPVTRNQTKMVSAQLSLPGREASSGPRFNTAHRGREKFDRWMRDSVVEIVKNLPEAPLFVHVYGGGAGTTMKTEKAVADDWARIEGRWKRGEEPSPEGIILVEELKEEKGNSDEGEGQIGESTKAFGVLLIGKGEGGGAASYLLKTDRVGSNLGLFCTHFCLARVKSFRETAASQFKNCWLGLDSGNNGST